MNGRRWTTAEDQHLRDHYQTMGAACGAAIGRTTQAVWERASVLRLGRCRRWSSTEDTKLAMMWGVHRIPQIAERLGRSEEAVYDRARVLDLGLGCPQGHESLARAAVRTGFARATLLKILRWAHVRIERGWTDPGWLAKSSAVRHRHYVVDAEAVDDAVARWLQTEPVSCAASRLGVDVEHLRRLLMSAIARGDARVQPPPRGRKRPWRVRTDTAAELVVEYRRTEGVVAAARRLGVRWEDLTAACREHGISVGRGIRLRPEDADRIASGLRRIQRGVGPES